MAVVVSETVAAADLEKTIWEVGSELLSDVRIFDVYQGGQIVSGSKSIAFALTFQADRTLTVEEVNVYQDFVKESISTTIYFSLSSPFPFILCEKKRTCAKRFPISHKPSNAHILNSDCRWHWCHSGETAAKIPCSYP